MTTRDALLRTILAQPEEDTPRLVYADYLEENGEEERAEFIRVQVEFDRQAPEHQKQADPSLELLRKRVVALFGTKWPQPWFGHDIYPCIGRRLHDAFVSGAVMSGLVRRGFVSEVRCELAVFRRLAPAVFAGQPITRVTLTDRSPHINSDGAGRDLFSFDPASDRDLEQMPLPGHLPRSIWNHPALSHQTMLGARRGYETSDAAMDALSTACVAYGRSREHGADLPPLLTPERAA